jgi:hypothetical protein
MGDRLHLPGHLGRFVYVAFAIDLFSQAIVAGRPEAAGAGVGVVDHPGRHWAGEPACASAADAMAGP